MEQSKDSMKLVIIGLHLLCEKILLISVFQWVLSTGQNVRLPLAFQSYSLRRQSRQQWERFCARQPDVFCS